MNEPRSTVRDDFDRIALLSQEGWDHNSHYHGFLLRHMPARCQAALEIGCGTGAFSRLLAGRSERVLALDLSPRMIEIAAERSSGHSNIQYRVADATNWKYPVEEFDVVASIATLHHLPIEETLRKLKGVLRFGGVLAVLDLCQAARPLDFIVGAAGVPLHILLSLLKNRRLRASREVREAWEQHGRHDTYPTLAEMRRICERLLPGAKVRKHLLWRYSIVWKKAM